MLIVKTFFTIMEQTRFLFIAFSFVRKAQTIGFDGEQTHDRRAHLLQFVLIAILIIIVLFIHFGLNHLPSNVGTFAGSHTFFVILRTTAVNCGAMGMVARGPWGAKEHCNRE